MSRQGRASSGCPCGSGQSYSRCCRPLHLRTAEAESAEALMRSRYSAFVKQLDGYLAHSWDPSSAPATVSFRSGQRWTGLEIVSSELGGPQDETGTVEFIASYEIEGRSARLQERSRFVRHQGRWVYLDGEVGSASE